MNQSGGGQPKGPWGQLPQQGSQPGSQPGGVRPPDLETLLKKVWADVRRYIPAAALGKNGLIVIGVVALLLWLASGIYTVTNVEQGVLLRFGAFVKHTGPGTHYHLPWPIETAYTPNVKEPNQLDIGFKGASDAKSPPEDIAEESHMLTGDESIVVMQFSVLWRIKDANAYLFNVDRGKSDDVVKALAESAMREVVGHERLDAIMTSRREAIQARVRKVLQAALDAYNGGIEVVSVKMQRAETPVQVKSATAEVQQALSDRDKKRSDAEAYANSVIPQAKGEAARIAQEAEGYKQQAIAIATGEAQRFNAVYQEYKKAPDVTRRRIYLETMTQVLAPMNKVIVDDAARGVTVQLAPAKPASLPLTRKPAVTATETPEPGGVP